MKGNTLEQRVMAQLGDDVVLPSATKSELTFCSKKLAQVTTIEEFSEVLAKYSLLDNKLKRAAGLSTTDFKRIIDSMKKEL
ncbi:MAG TPA: hypothetical protein EYG99_03165 [Candidatus Pacebacteria bacterium]|nr:hypothetical protein [Candidatus Paceibacterota bacterium]